MTKVTIDNCGYEHTVEVRILTVQRTAGKRELLKDEPLMLVAPGANCNAYVHENQELRIVERRRGT